MTDADLIRERILAYIYPRRPETKYQEVALDAAVDAQLAYESATGIAAIPEGAASVSNDGVSITFGGASGGSVSDICPASRAILLNAGLIKRVLPTARRL